LMVEKRQQRGPFIGGGHFVLRPKLGHRENANRSLGTTWTNGRTLVHSWAGVA
jgi:hypothetical protein